MELICASVCLTSMLCYTLEAKYRNQNPATGGENPFDAQAHMARHRLGARGNATSFPLPWQDILAALQHADSDASAGQAPDLPWAGEELSEFVSVIIKTSEEDSPKAMAKFVHQALVRREIVVQLIQSAKSRGHRAYRGATMERVRQSGGVARKWGAT